MEFSDRGFKFNSGQLSPATSKSLSVVITTCNSLFCYTHVITCATIRLK